MYHTDYIIDNNGKLLIQLNPKNIIVNNNDNYNDNYDGDDEKIGVLKTDLLKTILSLIITTNKTITINNNKI